MINKNKRIVFSIDENAICKKKNKVDTSSIEQICFWLSNLSNEGYQVVLVSAGAILMGMEKIAYETYPSEVSKKQALAAVGQVGLMRTYQKYFSEYKKETAQILLSRKMIKSHTRVKNACNTLNMLLKWNVIPIINENDTISIDDILEENNLPLALVVANVIDANYIVTKTKKSHYGLLRKYNTNIQLYTSFEELATAIRNDHEEIEGDKGKAFAIPIENNNL